MNYLRALISKNKTRFIDRKYNLDLSYITPRIITMAFPGDGFYGLIRNNIDDVSNFLKERHGKNYLVINLSGKKYDNSKFNNNVIEHRLVDHHAPSLNSLFEICKEIHDYLSKDISNVVVINCRAGKGRAGTVVCCYLLYTGRFENLDKAFNYYSIKRFYKGEGVTQPSQRRYVEYFYNLLKGNKKYFPYRINIKSIKIKNFDKTNRNGQYISPYCDFYVNNSDKITSSTKDYFNNRTVMVKEDTACITDENFSFEVAGDITIKISINDMFFIKKLGKISFNTAFLDPKKTEIVFHANEIDPENLSRKKKVPSTYEIILNIEKLCNCDHTKYPNSLCSECKTFLEKNNGMLICNKIINLVKDYKNSVQNSSEKTKDYVKNNAKNYLFGSIDVDDIEYVLQKNKINTTNKPSNINTQENDNENKINDNKNKNIEASLEKEEDEIRDDNEDIDDSYDNESSSEEEENEEEEYAINFKRKKKKNLNDSFDSECAIFEYFSIISITALINK